MGKYFGTDGVRGAANEKLNSTMAYRIGRYLGSLHLKNAAPKILIARDTRLSGQMLLSALTSGILASGGHVYDIGISTTPSISYLVTKKGFDFGIMISASHNPFYDNGIKVFSAKGTKISEALESEIEAYIDADKDYLPFAKNNAIGRSIHAPELLKEYIDFILSTRREEKQYRLLVDTANGSASVVAPLVFKELQHEVDYIGNKPDGFNINLNCGSTNLTKLKKGMLSGTYDLGIAFDGDADRILLVDKKGEEIDGDFIIYLLAKCLKKHQRLSCDTVVVTVMSNLGLLKALEKEGIKAEIVPVGDKYIQKSILDNGYSLGGEQSGHIILGDILNTGDGILTAVQLLNVLNDFSSIEEAFAAFNKYPQKLVNVVVENKDAVVEFPGLIEEIKRHSEELGDLGRILVRKSGTEPFVRVMVEAETQELCDYHANHLVTYIQSLGF